MNTFYVKNDAQRILFEHELKGQLSDGYWENARPSQHYKPWCDAKVVVSSDKVGRNFYAPKYDYDFSAPQLLEVVSDRMVMAVKLFMLYGIEDGPDSLSEYDFYVEEAANEQSDTNYWKNKVNGWHTIGLTREKMAYAEESNIYTMKKLKKDLDEIKQAARQSFQFPAVEPKFGR